MKLYFNLLKTLATSSEIAKEIMKMKFIEDLMTKLQPMCKNEKDIKLMKFYLSKLTGFFAGYAYTEDGQKAILVSYHYLISI